MINFVNADKRPWQEKEKDWIKPVVQNLADAFANTLNLALDDSDAEISSDQAWNLVFSGDVNFSRQAEECKDKCWAKCSVAKEVVFYNEYTPTRARKFPKFVLHELGHAFENVIEANGIEKPRISLPENLIDNRDGFAGPINVWQFSEDITSGEIFADMLIGWVYDKWGTKDDNLNEKGKGRSEFMNKNMLKFIIQASSATKETDILGAPVLQELLESLE